MKLGLFFTRSASLSEWVQAGLFDREKLIYERHLLDNTLTSVVWFTYGKNDYHIAEDLIKMGRLDARIIVKEYPRWFPHGRIGCFVYSFLLPLFQFRMLRKLDLLKTNQLDGAWAAVFARFLYGKPLLLRCGYVQSALECHLNRLPLWRTRLMHLTENFLYKFSDIAIFSSNHDAEYVATNFKVSSAKIYILPNYVDECLFSPKINTKNLDKVDRILFIGRLSSEKNLLNLVKAVTLLKIPLDLFGSGPLKEELEKYIVELGSDIRLMGTVSNNKLPAIINRYQYFALTSFREGMPKSLLEAMSCGLTCIGTDVIGINELIQDGVNGFLAKKTDAESISRAIERAQAANHVRISEAARKLILNKFTISVVAKKEKALFLTLMNS